LIAAGQDLLNGRTLTVRQVWIVVIDVLARVRTREGRPRAPAASR
jgi:hypothetical protein